MVPDTKLPDELIVPAYFAMHGYGGGGGVPGMSGASISTPLPLPRKLPVLELVIVALELTVPSALVTVVEIVEIVELIGVIVPLIRQGKGAASPSEVRLQLTCSKVMLGTFKTRLALKVTLSESTLVAAWATPLVSIVVATPVPAHTTARTARYNRARTIIPPILVGRRAHSYRIRRAG
jgi:hypothetical protein